MKAEYCHINPIIESADKIICFIAELEHEPSKHPTQIQVETWHHYLLSEIQKFELRMRKKNITLVQIKAASYSLCTCLDEIVMNTLPKEFDWSKNSLLSIKHNETWGGEHFYSILGYCSRRKTKYHELLEFMHLLLMLGYRGKLYAIQGEKFKQNLEQQPQGKNLSCKENITEHFKITQNNKPKLDLLQFYKFSIYSLTALLIINLISIIYYDHKLRVHGSILLENLK